MSEIKQQSTIKDMILATIEEHIDAQNEKGMKKYGETIDDCPVDDYSWLKMALEEAIDMLQYQQKEVGRLNELLKEKDEEIATMQYFLSRYQLKVEGLTDSKPELEQSPKEALDSVVDDYNAVSERDEIIEDLQDEIEGLKKQLKSLGSEYWQWRSSANKADSENKKLRDLLTHTWGED